MENKDGIYLNNTWVCPPDQIATTYQGNDLTKPDSLQTSHSNAFNLPDSLNVRKLTGNAEQLDSGSPYPYKLIPAYVIDGGETTFTGIARLTNFGGGWKAALYEEKRDVFTRLNRSIRTADLSRYDHPWTIENITARKNAIDGVCYPIIDYGVVSAGAVPFDTMFPAVFAHTILRQMLKEEGYRLVGEPSADPLFQRLVIPFTEQDGTNHDEKWATDRKARITQEGPTYAVNRNALEGARVMNRIQPFNIDYRPAEGWSQGILKNYDTTAESWAYVCDSNMRVKVDAFQQFKVSNNTGSVEFMLIVEVNSQNVHQEYFDTEGPYNLLFSRTDKVEMHKTISCRAGDRLQIRFICQRKTKLGAFRVDILNDSLSSWASFTPDLSLQTGDHWPVARNLPDLSGLELMVDIAHIFGGTWAVNFRRKEISFVGLSATIANTANAVDWSNRINTGEEPSWSPQLSPYAKKNYLRWKEIEDTKADEGVDAPNFGDGLITINSDALETGDDLFTLSLAATINSKEEVTGYGNPLRIETRTVSERLGSTDVTISKKSTSPRLILVSLEDSVPVKTKRLMADGLTIEEVLVYLKPCWFSVRPNVAIRPTSAFCLCFSPVKDMKGEQTLIDRHYQGLKRVLRRMRVLEVSARLLPDDISSLDFSRPIRLQRVSVGSLVLSDGYYYLNSINNYRSNSPCSVTLIGF